MIDFKKVEKEKKDHIRKLCDAIGDNVTKHDVLIQHMDKIKDQFLTAWKQYEINEISEQEFLTTSKKFAKVLVSDGEKVTKLEQFSIPLHWKMNMAFNDLEEKS